MLVFGEIAEGVDATGAIRDPVRSHVAVHCQLQMGSPALLHLALCLVTGGVAELPADLSQRRRSTLEVLHAVEAGAGLADRAQRRVADRCDEIAFGVREHLLAPCCPVDGHVVTVPARRRRPQTGWVSRSGQILRTGDRGAARLGGSAHPRSQGPGA